MPEETKNEDTGGGAANDPKPPAPKPDADPDSPDEEDAPDGMEEETAALARGEADRGPRASVGSLSVELDPRPALRNRYTAYLRISYLKIVS